MAGEALKEDPEHQAGKSLRRTVTAKDSTGKLRDECLNGEAFYSHKEAQMVIEKRRVRGPRELRPNSWASADGP